MRDIDLSGIRARLEASGQTWWRGLDELADTPEFRELLHREFPPGAAELDDDPAGRRDFLKLMGASLALAGVTGCTRQPPEKIVPYVRQPEEIVAGRPLYFATALPGPGGSTPVLVESHMGRPTKVEPNPQHPFSYGTDIWAQASILTLYDPDRSRAISSAGDIAPWGQFLQAITGALTAQRALQGAGLRILTETVTSPTLAEQIQRLLAAMPAAKWVQWDGGARDTARAGAKAAFGDYVEPHYRLTEAAVILSLDADFLYRGPSRLRHAREFADARRLVGGRTEMNRLYVVESTPTSTGVKADHRLPLRAADIEGFARAVAAGVGVEGAAAPASVPGLPASYLGAVVEDLLAHRGKSVVIAGEEQPPAVHALAHLINAALGNHGTTVVFTPTVEAVPSEQLAGLRDLAADLDAGTVDLLVVISANPVYTAPPDLAFAERLQKARLRVHLGLFEDETAVLCHWHVPEAHPLEAWSDTRAHDGTVSVVQPLIAPLYDGRSAHELLAVLVGQPDRTAYQLVRDFWQRAWQDRAAGVWGPMRRADGAEHAGFEEFWRQVVHDGFVPDSGFAAVPVSLGGTGVPPQTARPAGDLELTFRPDANVLDGRHANNGWLQELPRPVTKLTWDNAAIVSPATAARLGLASGYYSGVVGIRQASDLVTIRANGAEVTLPAWILPGQPDNSVALALGFGRARAGRVGSGVGADVNPLRTSASPFLTGGAEIRKAGGGYTLACTQGHFAIEGRNHVRAGTLPVYRDDPAFAHHLGHEPAKDMTVYPDWKYEGHAWGMSIDMNACVGCNSCVVACQSENNIPVVGKEQVARQREMHWIRIDRYYSGGVDNPQMFFQPMLCQHCENAPCEVVCPVAATVHSDEGLNDMVYNRCVGTRYCSNNCPYKVRRFNFLLYSDWNTPSLKLARNPDVTVRSRGVMEKCTYCVQRINTARIDAKREDRTIRDGEVVTACQSACPAQAIAFGDLNDKGSRVATLRAEPRTYQALGELNVRPRTTYLAAVSNPNPALAPAAPEHGAGGHGAAKTHATEAAH
jgi:molybdopterin-containing oxidoreductase family iron-sulfur binding subunit